MHALVMHMYHTTHKHRSISPLYYSQVIYDLQLVVEGTKCGGVGGGGGGGK